MMALIRCDKGCRLPRCEINLPDTSISRVGNVKNPKWRQGQSRCLFKDHSGTRSI